MSQIHSGKLSNNAQDNIYWTTLDEKKTEYKTLYNNNISKQKVQHYKTSGVNVKKAYYSTVMHVEFKSKKKTYFYRKGKNNSDTH